MRDDRKSISMMVATQRGDQDKSANKVVSKGLIRGPAVDMIDVLHGSFDFEVVQ